MNLKKDFIDLVCDILDLKNIKVREYKNLELNALFVPDKRLVKIKKGLDFKMWCLCVAHELRHVYQYDNNELNDYVVRDKLSLPEYNKQQAEIDAHAFSILMCEYAFNMTPILPFDPELMKLINKRKSQIKKTLMYKVPFFCV